MIVDYVSLLLSGSTCMNVTKFSKFPIINQVTEIPRNILLELKIIIKEHVQSFSKIKIQNTFIIRKIYFIFLLSLFWKLILVGQPLILWWYGVSKATSSNVFENHVIETIITSFSWKHSISWTMSPFMPSKFNASQSYYFNTI